MKDETKRTEIQAHIFQNTLIIVERFPVFYCKNFAHAQKTYCIRLCSGRMDLRKRSVLLRNSLKQCSIVCKLLDLPSLIYCVRFSVVVVYNKIKTLCTLYDWHTCSMCMLSVHDIVDTLEILRINHILLF